MVANIYFDYTRLIVDLKIVAGDKLFNRYFSVTRLNASYFEALEQILAGRTMPDWYSNRIDGGMSCLLDRLDCTCLV